MITESPRRRHQRLCHRRCAPGVRHAGSPVRARQRPQGGQRDAQAPELVRKMDAGEPFDVMIQSYDVSSSGQTGQARCGLAHRVRPFRRRRRCAPGRAETGLQHGRGIQTLAAQRQDHSDFGRRQQRALCRQPPQRAGHRRPGPAEDPLGRVRAASAQRVSRGELDFVVSGLPPLIGTPDIVLARRPARGRSSSGLVFSGGVGVNAKEPDAGRALKSWRPGSAGGVQGQRPGAAVALPPCRRGPQRTPPLFQA